MADISLQGMDELVRRVQELGAKASRVENQALRAGAEAVQKNISQRAPRSVSPRQPKPGTQSWRTGQHAADNIKLSGIKTKDGIKFIEVGVQRGDNSRYFYLKFKEYGTSKMSAEPFMEKAEDKGDALRAMSSVLKTGLGL